MVKMDRLDMRIVAHLQKDAAATNSQIAAVVGVSEETVRRRLRKLAEKDMIERVAIPNAKELGFVAPVIIGVQVDVGKVDFVADKLAEKPQVVRLLVTTGSFDMFAYANLKSTDNLSDFLRGEVGQIDGVRRMETFIVLSEEKEQHGVSMQAVLEDTFPDAPAG